MKSQDHFSARNKLQMAELPVTAVIEWPLHPLPYHNFLEVSSSFIWKGALVTLKHRNYNNPYLRVVKYRFFWSKLFKQVHTTHKPTDRTWHQQMNSFYKSEILTEFLAGQLNQGHSQGSVVKVRMISMPESAHWPQRGWRVLIGIMVGVCFKTQDFE